jgi:hypothetical protein
MTLMAVCCTCLLLSNAGDASAEGVDFRDDFIALDPARWSKGDHMLGRSYLDPANVDVENLRIKLCPPAPPTGVRSPPETSTVTVPTKPA